MWCINFTVQVQYKSVLLAVVFLVAVAHVLLALQLISYLRTIFCRHRQVPAEVCVRHPELLDRHIIISLPVLSDWGSVGEAGSCCMYIMYIFLWQWSLMLLVWLGWWSGCVARVVRESSCDPEEQMWWNSLLWHMRVDQTRSMPSLLYMWQVCISICIIWCVVDVPWCSVGVCWRWTTTVHGQLLQKAGIFYW